MSPAQPPFPTPANLPFHPVSGIQTSNRISESDVGAITPAIRQKGGRFLSAPGWRGSAKDPSLISCASVTAVFVGAREARPAHPAAGSWAIGLANDSNTLATRTADLMLAPILH